MSLRRRNTLKAKDGNRNRGEGHRGRGGGRGRGEGRGAGAKVAGAGVKVAGVGVKVAGAAVWTGAWGKVAGWEVAGGGRGGDSRGGRGRVRSGARGRGRSGAGRGWRTNDDATRDLFSVMNSNPRRPDGSLSSLSFARLAQRSGVFHHLRWHHRRS